MERIVGMFSRLEPALESGSGLPLSPYFSSCVVATLVSEGFDSETWHISINQIKDNNITPNPISQSILLTTIIIKGFNHPTKLQAIPLTIKETLYVPI